MVVAQKTKEAEITEQDSLLLTRNLLRIAIFNISYIRGLFPEKYFNDKSIPALEMKIKKLMPVDAEPRRLIDWMEKGVYDALQKKYLKTLLFCVCESSDGAMIEEYACPDNQEVSMNINRTGNKKQGGTFNCNSTTHITPNQMRSSACKMIRTLVQLMKTLDKMPDERTIIMKLLYHDDVTPLDYEPPFFRGCTEEEAHNPWTKNPLKMEIGNVNSKHLILTLKVKSVLDPCEDENDDIQDDEVSLGADSVQMDDSSSDSDSEISQTQEGEYVIAPVGIITEKQRPEEDIGMADADNTQDPEEDEQQFTRVKDWINSHQLDIVELDDIFSNFPDISAVLTDGNKELYHRFQAQLKKIMDKLVKEGILSKTGRGSYTIIRQKKFDYEFDVVKEELDGQAVPAGYKVPQVDDPLYMKALYHALQMKYVTVAGLQNKLDGEANQTAVRKLTNRMSQDGFLEAKGNRRLGKRVIHSRLSEKKLMEAKKAIGMDDAMDVEANEPHKSNHFEESNHRDASTCGGVHSIGSDLTRMKIRSGLQQNGSIRSEQTVSRTREHGNTPTSMAEPVASRESFVPENENSRTNGNGDDCEHADTMICSRSTPEKRCRKTSTVKEPILQSLKRQRSQAA